MQRFRPFPVVENAAFTVRRFFQHLERTGRSNLVNQTESHVLI